MKPSPPLILLVFGDIRFVYKFCARTVLCAFDRVVKVADCYQSAVKCSHPLWVPRESSVRQIPTKTFQRNSHMSTESLRARQFFWFIVWMFVFAHFLGSVQFFFHFF